MSSFVNQQPALQAGQNHFSENPVIMHNLESCPGFSAQLSAVSPFVTLAASSPRALLATERLLVTGAPGELFSLSPWARRHSFLTLGKQEHPISHLSCQASAHAGARPWGSLQPGGWTSAQSWKKTDPPHALSCLRGSPWPTQFLDLVWTTPLS